MIAKLWADEIIAGRREYKNVPVKLKDKVKALLIEAEKENLITE